MSKMKIYNLIESPLYEKIPCVCTKGIVMEEHPMKQCNACKFKICWDSVPKETFKVLDTKGKQREVKEITLYRGSLPQVL